jgi:hypothetical protein
MSRLPCKDACHRVCMCHKCMRVRFVQVGICSNQQIPPVIKVYERRVWLEERIEAGVCRIDVVPQTIVEATDNMVAASLCRLLSSGDKFGHFGPIVQTMKKPVGNDCVNATNARPVETPTISDFPSNR